MKTLKLIFIFLIVSAALIGQSTLPDTVVIGTRDAGGGDTLRNAFIKVNNNDQWLDSAKIQIAGALVDNQVLVATGANDAEGTTALTFSGQWLALLRNGIIGVTLSGDNGVSTNTIYAQNDDLNLTAVDDLFLTPADAIRFGSAAVVEAEFEILDGATVTTAELNVLDGIPGTLTATELGYSDGVTSAIQTQLNAKAPIADPTFTGEIGIGAVNVSETELGILEGATVTTAELNVLDGIPGTLTATELGYSDGVTSGIQTQLDSKLNTADTVTLASVAYLLNDTIPAFVFGAGAGEAGDTVLFAKDDRGFGMLHNVNDTLYAVSAELIRISAGDSLTFNIYWGNGMTLTATDSLFNSPEAVGPNQSTLTIDNPEIPPGQDVWIELRADQVLTNTPNEFILQLNKRTIRD